MPDGTGLLGLPHDALGLVLCALPTEARRAARAACRALCRARCHQARLVLRDAPPPCGRWPAWVCGEDGTGVGTPDVLLVAFARPLACLREISRRVAPARRVCLGRGSGLAEAHAALQLWPDPAVEVEVVSTAPYGLRVPPVSPRLRLRDVTACDDDPATLRAIAAWRPACVTFRAPAGLGAVSGAVAAYGDGSLVVHAHPGDADAALRLAPGARVAAVCWTGGPADGLAHLLERGGPTALALSSGLTQCWAEVWPALPAVPALSDLTVPAPPPVAWLVGLAPRLRSLRVSDACCVGLEPYLAAHAPPTLAELAVCWCAGALGMLLRVAPAFRRQVAVRFVDARRDCQRLPGSADPGATARWARSVEAVLAEPRLRVLAVPRVGTAPVRAG